MLRPSASWFPEVFGLLLRGQEIDSALMMSAVRDLVSGQVDEAQGAAFLTALRMKGETASEVAAAAMVLREQMIRLVPVSRPVLDTCGTGGDESRTFNISTASALVAAAAGAAIVKHGNRSVSSTSGSADVLRELGVPIDAGPVWAQQCLERIGFAFCYAPTFHRGMAHVAPLRRKLGIRTLFNLIGPLANPANAPYQLLGVGKPELLDVLAGALTQLEVRQAVVLWSQDGMDEVSLAAPTQVRVVRGESYEIHEWRPEEFGLGEVTAASLRVSDPAESAAMIRQVLAGNDGPALRITLANAAAALWTAEIVPNLREGVEKARQAIRGGHAQAILEQLISHPIPQSR